MKIVKRLLLGFLVVLILLVIAAIVGIDQLGKGMCGNYIFKEYISPNKKLKAVVFQRDCGATTGFSTQISILGVGKKLKNKGGNIFVVDGHPDQVAPRLDWQNNNELIIYKLLDGSEYKSEKKWGFLNPVNIVYKMGGS
jgi:hypothetical protein